MAYSKVVREAAAIVCSNYTGLNMAIDMGFGDMKVRGNKNLLQSGHVQIEEIEEYRLNSKNYSPEENVVSTAKRVFLVGILADLMQADEIEAEDFEDCIDDFMDSEFDS